MTRLPNIINLKIEQFSGAMEALAKGDEMNCIHDWDFTPDNDLAMFVCLKCSAKLDVVDAMNRLNMLEDDAARLRKEGEEYRAQLAARDALIERLVEAGRLLCDYAILVSVDHPIGDGQMAINDKSAWDALIAEWKASKDGGGE